MASKYAFNATVFKGGPAYPATVATTVTVYVAGTSTLAPLWSDENGVSTKANPFTLTQPGKLRFFTNSGYYDILVESAGESDLWESEQIGPGVELTVGAGATSFVDLDDVPASYAGQASRPVRVNSAENALVFSAEGPAYPSSETNRAASYALSDALWNAHDIITGSGTVVCSVPTGLPDGFVYFVTVDDGFTGSFTVAPGTGSPTVNAPYLGTLTGVAGGTIAVRKRASGEIDVLGDTEAAP